MNGDDVIDDQDLLDAIMNIVECYSITPISGDVGTAPPEPATGRSCECRRMDPNADGLADEQDILHFLDHWQDHFGHIDDS